LTKAIEERGGGVAELFENDEERFDVCPLDEDELPCRFC
jgi:hypothetical protein